MKILTIETSTEACSVALRVGEQVRELLEIAPRGHAERVLPMAGQLLREAGLGPADLDAVAFGRGPGAFTGVRIAVSMVQGIAFAANLPVIGVSTLAAVALQAARVHRAQEVAVALDARMGEVYWCLYRVDVGQVPCALVEECVSPPASVPVAPGGPWLAAGSGWQVHGEALAERVAVSARDPGLLPRAGDMAWLAGYAWQAGEAVPASAALPVYLRDEVAQPAAR